MMPNLAQNCWHKREYFSGPFLNSNLPSRTLRNVLGTKTLSEILMERDIISNV